MWILPKSLISASVVDTEELTLDCDALSQICAQSLMQRSKPSRSSFFSREWKAGRLMRLQSGAISSPSRGQRFLDAWTSSLEVIPASHSHPPVSDSEQTTSDTSGQLSQLAFGFCDQESASLKTSKGTSALGYGKSSMSWEQWVTERRGEYSARLKSARRTSASECSSWPTAKARDWKDTTGCSLDALNPDGTHRNRRDRLVGAIAAEMSGLPAQESPSTDGSRRELWPTPDATGANDGVPWEKFEQGMQERRAKVKAAVAAGQTKQGSGRSPNLYAAVQNPQWATPKASNPQHSGPNMRDSAGNYALPAQAVRETWATPEGMAGGKTSRGGKRKNELLLTGQVKQDASGKLNPRWVEALMGLPVGWVMPSCAAPVTIEPTSCGSWGMELSQQPPQELLPF